MRFLLADLGVKALYLTYLWLLSSVGASWLSARKGYGERPGLITSLLTSVIGTVVWLFWLRASLLFVFIASGAVPKIG